MIPRQTLATASALLLLGSTATGSLASRGSDKTALSPAASRPSPAMVVRSYFDALNRGMRPHDFRTLDRLYIRSVTLTESLTNGRPRIRSGFQQVLAFDHSNGLNWYVTDSKQISPNV